jgi:hypothetical protein
VTTSTRYPACAATAAAGALCCDTPTCDSPCLLATGTATCPRRLECSYMPGGGGDRWVLMEPAGPACAGGPCPLDAPTSGTSCAADGLRCDYTPHDGLIANPIGSVGPDGLGPRCNCSGGVWHCVGAICPPLPPIADSLALVPAWWDPADTFFADCAYPGRHCDTRRRAPGDPPRWTCVTPIFCPMPAPSTGSPCLVGADDLCDYSRTRPELPVDTYSGECRCLPTGSWECGPSTSSLCPPEQPAPTTTCPVNPAGDSCVYFDAAGARTRCTCATTGPITAGWLCY